VSQGFARLAWRAPSWRADRRWLAAGGIGATLFAVGPEARGQTTVDLFPAYVGTAQHITTFDSTQFEGLTYSTGFDIGGIESTAIGDFGAEVFANTSGQLGIDLRAASVHPADFHGDSAAIHYAPSNFTLTLPNAVAPNTPNVINISYNGTNSNTSIPVLQTIGANIGVGVSGVISNTTVLGGNLCVFACVGGSTTIDSFNENFPVVDYNITKNGNISLFGSPTLSVKVPAAGSSYEIKVSNPPDPPQIPGGPDINPNPLKIGVGNIAIMPPNLTTPVSSGQGFTTSVSDPTLATAGVDLLGVLARALNLPLNPFDLRVSEAGVSADLKILQILQNAELGLNQTITYNPALQLDLHASTDVVFAQNGVTSAPETVFSTTDFTDPITFTYTGATPTIIPEVVSDASLTNVLNLTLGLGLEVNVLSANVSFKGVSLGSVGPVFTDTIQEINPIDIALLNDTVDISSLFPVTTGLPLVLGATLDLPSDANTAMLVIGPFSQPHVSGNTTLAAGSVANSSDPLTVDAGGTLALAEPTAADGTATLSVPTLTVNGTLAIGPGTDSHGAASTLTVTQANGFTNVSAAGVLAGGTYNIGGQLQYNGADITTIAAGANVTVETGPGVIAFSNSGHDGLGSLAENDGSLTFANSTPFTTTAAFTNAGSLELADGAISGIGIPSFTNTGTLLVDRGAALDLTGGNFTNISGGVLSGGTYVVGGTIAYSGAPITTIAANTQVTLAGPGNNPGQGNGGYYFAADTAVHGSDFSFDQLASLTTNNGTLTLQSEAQQFLNTTDGVTAADPNYKLTNNGQLNVVDTEQNNSSTLSTLTVIGKVDNSATGTITVNGGQLNIVADQANGVSANLRNQGTITITNAGSDQGAIFVGGQLLDLDNNETLTGGTWNLQGSLTYSNNPADPSNGDIVAIGAGATVNLAGGTFINAANGNDNALSTLERNGGHLNIMSGQLIAPLDTNSGTLTVGGQGTQARLDLLGGTLGNTGSITVGALGQLFIGAGHDPLDLGGNGGTNNFDSGQWSSVDANGVLTNTGNLTVAGQVVYYGAAITAIGTGSNVTLSGVVVQPAFVHIADDNANGGSDALAALATIDGQFNLADTTVYSSTVPLTVDADARLTTDATSTLTVADGKSLTAVATTAPGHASADIVNGGVIALSGTSAGAQFDVAGTGAVTLRGGGHLVLSDLPANSVGVANGATLINQDNTIEGAGTIAGQIVNRGAIISGGSTGLTITNPNGGTLTNSGMLVSGGTENAGVFSPSTLTLSGLTIANSEGATDGAIVSLTQLHLLNSIVNGGVVETANSGTLTLDNSAIHGASITNQQGGTIATAVNTSNTIGGTIDNTKTALLLVDSGSTLAIESGSTFTNEGTVQINQGGTLSGGTLTNGGVVQAFDAGIHAIATAITNLAAGTIDIANGAILNYTGDLANAGNIAVEGAGSALNVSGNVTQTGGATLVNGGTLTFQNFFLNGGTLGGTGTIQGNVQVTSSTVTVGASPDPLLVTGNFVQNGGLINLEVDPGANNGFLTDTFIFNPGQTLSIENANIHFAFLGGVDPAAFEAAGLFDLDTFFRVTNGATTLGLSTAYNLDQVFQNDTFTIGASNFTITQFAFGVDQGVIQLAETAGMPAPPPGTHGADGTPASGTGNHATDGGAEIQTASPNNGTGQPVTLSLFGGNGGDGANGATSGNGGDANSTLTVTTPTPSTAVNAFAAGTGGNGGNGTGGSNGGNGGNGSATATAGTDTANPGLGITVNTGNAMATAQGTGGNGGGSDTGTGGDGGNGQAAATAITNSPTNSAIASATAAGGQGGSGGAGNGSGGSAQANATATNNGGGAADANALSFSHGDTATSTATGSGGSGFANAGSTTYGTGALANQSITATAIAQVGSMAVAQTVTSVGGPVVPLNVPFTAANHPAEAFAQGNLAPDGASLAAVLAANPALPFNQPGSHVVGSGLLSTAFTTTLSAIGTAHSYSASLTFSDLAANVANRDLFLSILSSGGYADNTNVGATFGTLTFFVTDSWSLTDLVAPMVFNDLATAEAVLDNLTFDLGMLPGSVGGMFDVTFNLDYTTSFANGFQTDLLFGYAAAASAVPEPASGAIFAGALLGWIMLCRRSGDRRVRGTLFPLALIPFAAR